MYHLRKNMKMEICTVSKNNCLLRKFKVLYQYLKDTRPAVHNTSIRINTFNPGYS